MFKIKDEAGFDAAYSENTKILKFIDGRKFNFSTSNPQYLTVDGKEFYISDISKDTRVWFSNSEFYKFCEEVPDVDIVIEWAVRKAGFSSMEEALQEFNKPKLLQIKKLEEQIETLKSQLAR